MNDEELKELLSLIRPIDDVMFRFIAKDMAVMEEILRVVMDDRSIAVESAISQYTISNLAEHSVTLDAYFRLNNGTVVDFEVQRANNDNLLSRLEYYYAMLLIDSMPKGTNYREGVRDIVMIALTEYDAVGNGEMLNVMERVVRKGNMVLESQRRKTYLINTNGHWSSGEENIMKLANMFSIHDYFEEDIFPLFTKLKHNFYDHQRHKGGVINMEETFDSALQRMILKYTELTRQEVTEEVTNKVTEEVTNKVTEEVTNKVTEEVTAEVTNKVSFNNKVEVAINMYNGLGIPYEKTLAINGISEADMPLYLEAIRKRLGV